MAIIPYLLAPLVIIIFYRAFRQPEKAFAAGWQRTTVVLIAIIYAFLALAPLLNGDRAFSHLFFVYPLLYAVLFRRRILGWLGQSARRGVVTFCVVFLLLWFQEIFVVLDYGGDIVAHLSAYIGFYLGIPLTFTLLRRWNYSFAQLFTIGGLWGVLIEQEFLGPKMLLAGDWGGFFWFAPYIFVVYGLYLAGPYLLFCDQFKENERPSRLKLLVYFTDVLVIPLLTWGAYTQVFGLIVPN